MSAVVHTGSSEARSACGTKVIVLCASVRATRGMASTAAPASPDLRTSRRFMAAIPLVVAFGVFLYQTSGIAAGGLLLSGYGSMSIPGPNPHRHADQSS